MYASVERLRVTSGDRPERPRATGTLALMRSAPRVYIASLLILVAAGVVGVIAAGSASARPSALSPAERHDLLQKFMPILYFHADEVWSPVAVEGFLRVAGVERQTKRG